jgi:N-acetylglucosamine kinase-like BadF-type ATPase
VSGRVILAVDGGNSKTDLVLAGEDGSLLAFARGPGCSPHRIGLEGCVDVIAALLETARTGPASALTRPAAAAVMVAGADLDSEARELRARLLECDWADRLETGNDTLAVLRAGGEDGYGVAVVCGAGINAVGVAPDGRSARFPALGAITGDWGGGGDLGLAALGEAVRAGDGRGGDTVLAELVPSHFSLASAEEVALAVHRREIDQARLVELAPLVLGAADEGDATAVELRERLVGEVLALVRAAATRVLAGVARYEVVLGGSLLSRSQTLGRLAAERIRAELPGAEPKISAILPVAGSAAIALDAIGAAEGAAEALRAELTHARGVPGVVLEGSGAGA